MHSQISQPHVANFGLTLLSKFFFRLMQPILPTKPILKLRVFTLIFLGSLSIASFGQIDGPLRVTTNSNFGLTVLNQNIANGADIILHEGLNTWVMLSNGAIVLKDNPKFGLTVLNQNIASGSKIILHEGYNRWQLLSNGAIVLADNPTFGITVLNQDIRNGASIIIHEGYNLWTQNIIPIPAPEVKKDVCLLFHQLHCKEKGDGFFGGNDEVIFQFIVDGVDVTYDYFAKDYFPRSYGPGSRTNWVGRLYATIPFKESCSIIFTEEDTDKNDMIGRIDLTRADLQRESANGVITNYITKQLVGAGDYEFLYHVLYCGDTEYIMVP
jgi:hypothetical protein